MLLAFCDKSYIVQIMLIVKMLFKIACYLAPIIIIIASIIHIFKVVLNGKEDDFKDALKVTVKRIIAGLVIALLPALTNYVFSLVNASEVDFIACFESASKEKVASLKAKEDAEEEAKKKAQEKEDEKILRAAYEEEQKQKGAKKQSFEEWKKEREEAERRRQEEYNNANNPSSNNNQSNSSVETSYGVFLGLDHDSGIDKLLKYKMVAIDLQEYSKEDIDKLHAQGIKVYSYLNIGSVEKYRKYYNRFKNLYLGTYENWEDEKWVDVSNKDFQNFIINELEPSLRNKGADGYFIDNCDVYAVHKKESIYNGLKTILSSIHQHGKPMLINGGDEFVSKAISDGSYSNLFDGVNQEEVFTLINFDNKTYKNQEKGETERYKKYLQQVKSKNLKVYLLEYGANQEKEQEIKTYCEQNGFAYYNSKSYNLD